MERPQKRPRLSDQNDRSVDPEGDFYRRRNQNDLRLKSRFEAIFEKYSKDFAGVGDEIDLESGEIVVNNGHIEVMKDEQDVGFVDEGQRYLRAFTAPPEDLDDIPNFDADGNTGEESPLSDDHHLGNRDRVGLQQENDDVFGGLLDEWQDRPIPSREYVPIRERIPSQALKSASLERSGPHPRSGKRELPSKEEILAQFGDEIGPQVFQYISRLKPQEESNIEAAWRTPGPVAQPTPGKRPALTRYLRAATEAPDIIQDDDNDDDVWEVPDPAVEDDTEFEPTTYPANTKRRLEPMFSEEARQGSTSFSEDVGTERESPGVSNNDVAEALDLWKNVLARAQSRNESPQIPTDLLRHSSNQSVQGEPSRQPENPRTSGVYDVLAKLRAFNASTAQTPIELREPENEDLHVSMRPIERSGSEVRSQHPITKPVDIGQQKKLKQTHSSVLAQMPTKSTAKGPSETSTPPPLTERKQSTPISSLMKRHKPEQRLKRTSGSQSPSKRRPADPSTLSRDEYILISSDDELQRSPVTTVRISEKSGPRCGENGFECNKDYCFRCL